MTIKQKMLVNLFVFTLVAIYFVYHEAYTFHPDAFEMFNLNM